MKIILANGTELNPIMVTGGGRFVNGSKRDTLSFIFDESASLDELDALFTGENCEKISLFEDGEDGTVTEHIYTGYTIRAELSRTPMVTKEATDTTEAVIENRVTVSMALRNYVEYCLDALKTLLGESEG